MTTGTMLIMNKNGLTIEKKYIHPLKNIMLINSLAFILNTFEAFIRICKRRENTGSSCPLQGEK